MEGEQNLRQALGHWGAGTLLKLADLENELQDVSLDLIALGIAAELAPSYFFDDDEAQRVCEVLQRRRDE